MQELLDKGKISSNTSSCGSPSILALKNDGAWQWQWQSAIYLPSNLMELQFSYHSPWNSLNCEDSP